MVRYCTLCHRPVEPRRHFGIPTLVVCLLTSGLWLLVMPFYRKRCPICRTCELSDTAPATPARQPGSAP